jgi:hypothetical protein
MEIPYSRWYEVIWFRRSRRQFDSSPLDPYVLEGLATVCTSFRPFTGVRAVLVNDAADIVFKGIVSHYGKIKGAPAFIAFIGNMEDPNVHEKLGYTGEGIILEATAMKLGTCWVGVSFHAELASRLALIKKHEKVLALTPVGYTSEIWSLEEKIMTGFGITHKRKPLEKLLKGGKEASWPLWVKTALEAARVAPSAVNRQPWRFSTGQNGITISVDNLKDTLHISKRLDCGIAMLHIELASNHCGVKGEWKFLDSPQVARFEIAKDHRADWIEQRSEK